MTMPPAFHPDDERLAAYAAGEPDAVADAALARHVADCPACGPLVADLRSIRTALSNLPDLPPPRPLRFLPPVPASSPARSLTGWMALLRRLSAPVMGVAAVLILVGAVGSTGVLHLPGATSADLAAPATATGEHRAVASASDGKVVPGTGGTLYSGGTPAASPLAPYGSGRNGSATGGQSFAPVPSAEAGDNLRSALSTRSEAPYPWILGAGVILLAGGLLVRAATGRSLGRREDDA